LDACYCVCKASLLEKVSQPLKKMSEKVFQPVRTMSEPARSQSSSARWQVTWETP
jgi:hypothetical protein